jgi:predicted RNase H-like HicB family nuclease
MASARYKLLEDKTYFGEIPGLSGVWAGEKNLEKCRETLQEVLEDWIMLKLRDRDALPAIHGKKLSLPEAVRA